VASANWDQGKSQVTFLLKNIGHSAALNIAVQTGLRPAQMDAHRSLLPGFLESLMGAIPIDLHGPALADGSAQQPVVLDISEAELIKQTTENHALIAYMKVSYKDIFDQTKEADACVWYRYQAHAGPEFRQCPSLPESPKIDQKYRKKPH
jgi:hypothetical protein